MNSKIILLLVIVAGTYWYWSGPYQEQTLSAYDRGLQENSEKMALCKRGKNYNAGATGEGTGNAQERCAEEYNLYQHEGQWHSYDAVRKGD